MELFDLRSSNFQEPFQFFDLLVKFAGKGNLDKIPTLKKVGENEHNIENVIDFGTVFVLKPEVDFNELCSMNSVVNSMVSDNFNFIVDPRCIMAHLVFVFQVFDSVTLARKNNWNKPIPKSIKEFRIKTNQVKGVFSTVNFGFDEPFWKD